MAATNLRQPLTMEQCAELNRILEVIPDAIEFAGKLKDCGVDCERHIATLRAQQLMATKFKKHFFPECP